MATAVHALVHQVRRPDGSRRVVEIAGVESDEGGGWRLVGADVLAARCDADGDVVAA